MNQKYQILFSCSSCNNNYCSSFTEAIEKETRFSKYFKAALAPFVFIGGTIASPIAFAVGTGTLASITVKKGVTAAGVAARVAGGVGGGIVGTAFPPVDYVGGLITHTFV